MTSNTTFAAGTVSVTAGSAVVNGTGISPGWNVAGISPGDFITIEGLRGVIQSVDGSAQITMTKGWPGANGSGLDYFIEYAAQDERAVVSIQELLTEYRMGRVSTSGYSPDVAGLSAYTGLATGSLILVGNAGDGRSATYAKTGAGASWSDPAYNTGPRGAGFTGGSHNPATGISTFTSVDGLGFSTSDLRGAAGISAGHLAASALLGSEAGFAIDYGSNAWVKRTLDHTGDGSGTVTGIGTFSRASSIMTRNAAGLLEDVASGVFAWQHDPVNGRGASALFAGESQNLWLHSNDMSLASSQASPNDTTISVDVAAAGDGTTIADKVIASIGAGSKRRFRHFAGAVSTNYTMSLEAAPAGFDYIALALESTGFGTNATVVVFSLLDGSHVVQSGTPFAAPKATRLPSGRWLVEITAQSDADGGSYSASFYPTDNATSFTSTTGDGVAGVYVSEVQVEALRSSSPRIRTAASAVARTFARHTIPLSSIPAIATEGTLIIKGRQIHKPGTLAVNRVVRIQNASLSDYISPWVYNLSDEEMDVYFFAAGAIITLDGPTVPSAIGQTFHVAMTWSQINGRIRYFGNGAKIRERTGVAAVPNVSGGSLLIGAVGQSGVEIEHAVVIPRELSEAELIERTTL